MLNSLIGAAALLATNTVHDAPTLDYSIDIASGEAGTTVHVGLEFTGDEDGTTEIVLPSSWGGQDQLWGALDGFELSGDDDGRVEAGEDASRLILHHRPGATITLNYQILPERVGEPQAELGDYYRPYVEPDWVHLIGHTIFAFPQIETDPRVRISINAPDDWGLATDLNHGELDINTLLTSVTVAGEFRVNQRDISGAPVRVAIRGEHALDDDALMAATSQVIAANLDYWGADGSPYLVTVLPLEAGPGVMSVGGTNLGDAFAFFATGNAEAETLMRILMHEHVHTWVPGQVGGSLDGEQEPAGYWFSEGMTDFLTQRAAVRAGVWSAQTALENWNQTLRENNNSPVRDVPNSEITAGFWSDGNLQRLPYHRGMIFAALIDHAIRTQSDGQQSIDDALLAMYAAQPETPAPLAFASVVMETTGLDIAPLLERHIVNGVPVTLPPDTFGNCGTVGMFTELVFDYGMSGHRNDAGRLVIDEVAPDGPAAPAGFEPGMVILERLEGAVGDATVDSVLRVRSPDGSVSDLRYRPTRGETNVYPRIALADTDLVDNGCAALLGGPPL